MVFRIYLVLILCVVFILNAQTNIGFYTLKQKEGASESKWMERAIPEMLIKSFGKVKQVNVVGYEKIDNYLKENHSALKDPLDIASYEMVKKGLNLQYLITGSYRHEQNNGLPVNIIIYNFQKNRAIPVVIRGYANDLATIISYLTGPISRECNLILNPSEKELLRNIDVSTSSEALMARYRGEINLKSGDFKNAVINFEKAYRLDPESGENKLNYDKALEHFYGNGLFSLKLLETDKENISDFSRQYLLSKKIFNGYKAEVLSSELTSLGEGSFFNINVKIRLKTTNEMLKMANETINKSAQNKDGILQDGVYTPEDDEELSNNSNDLEKNICSTIVKVECLDFDGNVIYSGSQNLKAAFGIRYSGETGYNEENSYKKLFRQNSIDALLIMSAVSRDLVKQIYSIRVELK